MRLEEEGRSNIEDVESLAITAPGSGNPIRLSNVARVYEVNGPVQKRKKHNL